MHLCVYTSDDFANWEFTQLHIKWCLNFPEGVNIWRMGEIYRWKIEKCAHFSIFQSSRMCTNISQFNLATSLPLQMSREEINFNLRISEWWKKGNFRWLRTAIRSQMLKMDTEWYLLNFLEMKVPKYVRSHGIFIWERVRKINLGCILCAKHKGYHRISFIDSCEAWNKTHEPRIVLQKSQIGTSLENFPTRWKNCISFVLWCV